MGSGKSNTSTTTSTPAAAGAASSLIGRANKLSKQPYVPYNGSLLANLTPDQQAAFSNVNAAQGIASPYIDAAEQYNQQGAAPISQENLDNYQNPYQQKVTQATLQNFGELNAQQLAQVKGNAIGQGALGGNRLGVAQGEAIRQQKLAEDPVLAGINSQGFNTALSAAQQDKARQGQAAFTEGGLGQEALGTTLQGAQAQLGTGAIQQNQAQQGLNIPYQQFLQKQAFPYQQLGFASGVTGQLGALMGGTSTTTAPGPSPVSQYGGLALGLAGLFAKDGGAIKGYEDGGAVEGYAAGGSPGISMPYGMPSTPYGMPAQPYGMTGGPYTDTTPRLSANILSGVPYSSTPQGPTGAAPSSGIASYIPPINGQASDPNNPQTRGSLGVPVPAKATTAQAPNIDKMFSAAMKMAQKIRNTNSGGTSDDDIGDGTGQSTPSPSMNDVSLNASPDASAGIPGSQDWSGMYSHGGIVVSNGGAVAQQPGGIYMPRGYDDGGTVDDNVLFNPNPVSSQDFVPPAFAPKQEAASQMGQTGIAGNVPMPQPNPNNGLNFPNTFDEGDLGPAEQEALKRGRENAVPWNGPPDDLTGLDGKSQGISPPMPNGRQPASIRNNNPGAQWPGPTSAQFGATGAQNLADGNKIATFPTPVHGAAAQFALLNKNYVGIPLAQAITKWSGGNSSPAYVASIAKDTGLTPGTIITPDLLQSDKGVQLAKAMAKVETGRPYPMSDDQWKQGQALAFDGTQPPQGIANPLSGPVDKPVSAGIAGAEIPPAAKPAEYKSNSRGFNLGLIPDNMRVPLIAAGLGMLASRSPNLGNAIGEGGLAGLGAYTTQKQQETTRSDKERDYGLKERSVDLSARRLDQAAEMAQKKLEQGRVPAGYAMGKDGNMQAIPGGPADPAVVEKLKNAKQNPDALLDDDTTKFMAEQYRAGDTSVLTNLGRGAQGAQNIVKVRQEIQRQNKEGGYSGSEQAARNAEFFGTKAGQRTLGTRSANIELAATEFKQVLPVIRAASQAVSRTNFPDLNKVIQAANEKTGDPAIVAFGGGVNTLINLYARAISPTGVPTVSDKDHAREILTKSWSQGQFDSAVGMMEKEIDAALASPEKVRTEMRKRFLGGDQSVTQQPQAVAPSVGTEKQFKQGIGVWNGNAWVPKQVSP